ncbi:MAG: ComEA family DNA-binding protein [Clostridia bacterium]|nr:ComEA family DNA-binding protein [Clostridia bacterium]
MQPLRGAWMMKISTLEKILLGCTAAFLVLTAGYYLGVRSSATPYRVDVESRKESPAPSKEASEAAGPAPGSSAKININTAAAEELMGLPGIGEKRAQDIVADREKNGPFRIAEDITRVKGIGEGTLAELIGYITVD